MKRFKKSALLLCSMMVMILMSTSVFATDSDSWVEAKIMDSSIGVSKQTAEISSISYVADKNVGIEVNNDKFSISSGNFNFSSEVYVSNSVENEADLDNVTYHKVENGAKTGIVYFDSKKIDVRYVTSYFNVKVVTGDNASVIKIKTTVNYGDLYVYAFQMNTNHDKGGVSEFNPSYRVVNYCGNVLANGNNLIPVKGFGTVYGIDGTFTEDDLVKNSSNNKVYSFDATEQGLVDVKGATRWDNYYAVTFKNLSYNPELLDRSYTLRPYAILEDGSIMYSDDVQSTSIYDVANVLYERNAMSTKEARNFLLKHILNVVKIKNGYADVCKDMLKVLNVTDTNGIDYKYVNTLYKDLFYYVQLTHDYTVDHYYNRGDFVAKTFVDGKDLNTELLDKLNKASGTNYDTISDYIKFESPKHGVEGSYVPAGVYVDNKLMQEWTDLVKNGDVLVDDDTLKSVGDNVKGDLVLPETVKKVESAKGSNLNTVTVPSTVEEIKDDAFSKVSNITYNGDATGAPWEADKASVKGNGVKTNEDGSITKTIKLNSSNDYTSDAINCSNYYSIKINGNGFGILAYKDSTARPNVLYITGNEYILGLKGTNHSIINSDIGQIKLIKSAYVGECTITYTLYGKEYKHLYKAQINGQDVKENMGIIETNVGVKPTLPSKVSLLYSNGETATTNIQWDNFSVDEAGTKTIIGKYNAYVKNVQTQFTIKYVVNIKGTTETSNIVISNTANGKYKFVNTSGNTWGSNAKDSYTATSTWTIKVNKKSTFAFYYYAFLNYDDCNDLFTLTLDNTKIISTYDGVSKTLYSKELEPGTYTLKASIEMDNCSKHYAEITFNN